MEKVKNVCLTFVLISIVHRSHEQMFSLCPRQFVYEYDGTTWFGVITVPSQNIKNFLKLNVSLSTVNKLPTSYIGHVDILGDRTDIYMNIMNKNPIKYKVIFPVQTEIPSIRSIVWNGLSLCQINDETEKFIIELNHELYLSTPESDDKKNKNSRLPNKGQIFYEIISNVIGKTDSLNTRTAAVRNKDSAVQSIPNVSMIHQQERPNPDTFAIPINPRKEKPEGNKMYDKNSIKNICGQIPKNPSRKPWLVAVYVKGLTKLDFRSSGSLISENLVVTAAQAVAELNNRPIRIEELIVRVGTYNLEDWENTESLKSVKEITFHPKFDRTALILKDNIVLLKIRVIKFDQFLSPVCLIASKINIIDANGMATGWVADNDREILPIPTTTSMVVRNNDVCKQHPSLKPLTTSRTLCVCGDEGINSCYEDQGRGLTFTNEETNRWYLGGLLSYSLTNPDLQGTCNRLPCRIFTDLTKYSEWIENYL